MTACKSCKTLSNPYVSLLIGQIHGLGNSLRRNFAFSIQIHLFTVILSPLGLLPSMLAGDDESVIEAGEALEDVSLRVIRTSDVYSLIS